MADAVLTCPNELPGNRYDILLSSWHATKKEHFHDLIVMHKKHEQSEFCHFLKMNQGLVMPLQ